jgi:dephospho-CoA kinase
MIFGITGTLGAGKGEIVSYLVSQGFHHYSARQLITEEVLRRGLAVNRDSMTEVANSLREEHGPAYVFESLVRIAEEKGGKSVVESVRTIGEVEALKARGGFLIAIDADPHTRYNRVVKRGSETDDVSYEKFISDEERESISEDPGRQNLRKVSERADFHIQNDADLASLHRQIDAILATVLQS